MPTAPLPDRTVILVDGPEAEHFLQNIVTTDLDALAEGEAKPGALLSPQGKILFDFLVSRAGGNALLLDVRADLADDFMRRLTLYRLRAKAAITKQEQALVLARWRDDSATSSVESGGSETDSTWLVDARFPAGAGVERGYAGMSESAQAEGPPPLAPPRKGEGDVGVPESSLRGGGAAAAQDWKKVRITHGIVESGDDFAAGDAFPHDVLYDETGGVGFRKGCYIGQEVVSRMHHRGTARRRVMLVAGESALPAPGADIRANGRAIGTLGSAQGGRGLAIVRIDRVKDALDAGHAITAGDVPVTLSIPPWAKYTLPQDAAGAGEA